MTNRMVNVFAVVVIIGWLCLEAALWLSAIDLVAKLGVQGVAFFVIGLLAWVIFQIEDGEELLTEKEWEKRNTPTTGPKD